MNLTLRHEKKLYKRLFELRSKQQNGLILNILQDTPQNHDVRFKFACFSSYSQILALIDVEGFIFIIDMSTAKYWNFPRPLDGCSAFKFSNSSPSLLVGLKGGAVHIVDVQSGETTGSLVGHKYPVVGLSEGRDFFCLTSSLYEAVLWDLRSCCKIQVLNLSQDCSLKQVNFVPVSNDILVCFNDGSIEAWDSNTFEIKRQLAPKLWFDSGVRNVTFSLDGKTMVLACKGANLGLFLLSTFELVKYISLPEQIQSLRFAEFVPQINDGGANKILALLTGRGSVYFYDLFQDLLLNELITANTEILRYSFGPNFVACVLCSGCVAVYDFMHYIAPKTFKIVKAKVSSDSLKRRKSAETLYNVKQEIKEMLGIEKLKLILSEYGQYPDSYRAKIWQELLQLPNQTDEYNKIINNRAVTSFEDLQEKYPLESARFLKNLRKLLSDLVSWCQFFLNIDYLPLFVFPFSRIFEGKPIICFEAMCTIIMNWCQYWFEYFPLPPLNILTMIENMMMEQAPDLLNYLIDHKISSEIYAWTLLKSAFSEVLTSGDWKILWDHVLTNEPSLLLCGVVSYNVLQRTTILSLKNQSDIEFFYSTYHPVDIKKLLTKSYQVLNTTNKNIHPRQFLNMFKKIEGGEYPILHDYPRSLIEIQNNEKAKVRQEINRLTLEEISLLKQRINNYESFEQSELNDEENRRVLEMEHAIKKVILDHQKQLQDHYDRLSKLRELSQKEEEMLNAMKQKVSKRTISRDRLLASILGDVTLNLSEKKTEIRRNESDLLLRYSELLKSKEMLQSSTTSSFHSHQEKLSDEIKKLSDEPSAQKRLKVTNLFTGMTAIDVLIGKIERELKFEGKSSGDVLRLRAETSDLMAGINKLLNTLIKCRSRDLTT